MGLLDMPMVKLALGGCIVLVIANLPIAVCIKASLQTGTGQAMSMMGVLLIGWVFTGMRK